MRHHGREREIATEGKMNCGREGVMLEENRRGEKKMGGNDKEKITFKQNVLSRTCEDDLKARNNTKRRRGTFRKKII
jgi:hypothetical protein